MYIHINRQVLYYGKTGSGSPIILLHGNGEDHTIFDELVPILAIHHTVYTVDSRGHGESNPTDDYHYQGMADDIFELILSLEIEKPMLLGFSDGGIVGLLLAIQHSNLLSRLIVCGANINPGGIRFGELHKMKKHYKKTGSPLERMMLEEPDIKWEQLGEIAIHVLVLAGEKDMIKPGHTKKLAKLIPDSRLQVIEGEDHGSYVIHSTKVYPYIQNFIK